MKCTYDGEMAYTKEEVLRIISRVRHEYEEVLRHHNSSNACFRELIAEGKVRREYAEKQIREIVEEIEREAFQLEIIQQKKEQVG